MQKLLIALSLLLFSIGTAFTQTINFELTSTTPEFQDADGGDMEFADIDNDGDNDLIITGKGGPVRTTLYRNDGEGNFTEIEEDVIADVFNSKIGLSDIENDGDIDMLISGSTGGGTRTVFLYLNDGLGNFSVASNLPLEPFSGDFEFADIDGDGDDDILLLGLNSSDDPITKLYENDGTGSFSEITSTSFPTMKFGAIEFLDYDNDDDLDVILTGLDENDNNLTRIYINNGSGDFNENAFSGLSNMNGSDIAVGDTDGDGDMDVLLCGNLSNVDIETELYLNDGTGQFLLLEDTPMSDVAFGEASFNDFDNDGDLDIFVIGTGEGGLNGPNGENTIVGNVYENQGSNNFIVADSLIGGYISSHAVADVNGDDKLDLILGGTTISSPIRATWMYRNITEVTVSTEDLETFDNVELYPNPTSGILNIKLSENTEATVNIYSQLGQLVFSKEMLNDFIEIDLDLSQGVYFVEIRNREMLVSKKLVVQE
ncbi:MAG: hypothetical protein ACI85O_001865 [Saprospiraceae bacterium]|jgi:hypothetical protein